MVKKLSLLLLVLLCAVTQAWSATVTISKDGNTLSYTTPQNFGTIEGTGSIKNVYDVSYDGTSYAYLQASVKANTSLTDYTPSDKFSASFDAATHKLTVTAAVNTPVTSTSIVTAYLCVIDAANQSAYAIVPVTVTLTPKYYLGKFVFDGLAAGQVTASTSDDGTFSTDPIYLTKNQNDNSAAASLDVYLKTENGAEIQGVTFGGETVTTTSETSPYLYSFTLAAGTYTPQLNQSDATEYPVGVTVQTVNNFNVTYQQSTDYGTYSVAYGDESVAMGEPKATTATTQVTLTANPAEGYVLKQFVLTTESGTQTYLKPTETNKYVGNINVAGTVTAEYEKHFSITYSVLPAGCTYTVFYNDETTGKTIPGACDTRESDQVKLTATVARGYVFVGWAKDGTTVLSTDNPATVSFTSGCTVVPVVKQLSSVDVDYLIPGEYSGGIYKIEYQNNGETIGVASMTLTPDVTPSKTDSWGVGYKTIATFATDKVTLTPYAQRGSKFDSWNVTVGENTTSSKTINSQNIPVACTISPYFDSKDPTNVTYASPTTGGDYTVQYKYSYIDENGDPQIDKTFTITDRGTAVSTYEYDDITLTATPDGANGYVFSGWYKNGELVSKDKTYSCNIPANCYNVSEDPWWVCDDVTIEARFSNAYNVTFASNDLASVTVKDADGNAVTLDQTIADVIPSTKFTASYSDLNSDYEFIGWYVLTSENQKMYISRATDASQAIYVPCAGTVYADIVAKNAAPVVCSKVGVRYENLSDAFSATDVAILCNNATLAAGTCEIPSDKTLVIPFDAAGTVLTDKPNLTTSAGALKPFKTLTMANGATLNVSGNLCVGGQQHGTSSPNAGLVTGAFGAINMANGGTINLESGSNLYAWGFVLGQSYDEKTDKGNESTHNNTTGVGHIYAKSGSHVYEAFQINDLAGGGITSACVNGDKAKNPYGIFPFNQYYIQNVEVPMTINSGATEQVHAYIESSSAKAELNIKYISNSLDGFFYLYDGATITKWYDATTDHQCYKTTGQVSINGFNLDLTVAQCQAKDFVLPLTNNLNLEIANGTTVIPYAVALYPGANIKVNTNANLMVYNKFFVYDADNWDRYAYYYKIRPLDNVMTGYNSGIYTSHLQRGSYGKAGDKGATETTVLPDAMIDNYGTITLTSHPQLGTTGALFTSEGGANICGHNGAKILLTAAAPEATSDHLMYKQRGCNTNEGESYSEANTENFGNYSGYKAYCRAIPMTAAKLMNADGSYTATGSLAAGKTITYSGDATTGKWALPTDVPAIVVYKEDGTEETQSQSNWTATQTATPNAIAVTTDASWAADKTNVIVSSASGNTCSNLVVTDGNAMKVSVAFNATSASYKRSVSNNWGTICLPFQVTSNSDVQYYQLDNVLGSTMTFTPVQTVEANVPAVFKKLNGTEINPTASNAAVPVTDALTGAGTEWKLIGSFEQKTLTCTKSNPIYYISNNAFYNAYERTAHDVTVTPFRAYFQATSAQTAPARMTIMAIDATGETTNIGELDAQGNIQESSKFLQNGRLYLRKNGHIFNAAGQVVK